MSNAEPDVKIIERVEVAPAEDDETVEAPDSSQEAKPEEEDSDKEPESDEDKEPEAEAEEPESSEPEPIVAPKVEIPVEKYGEVRRMEVETNKEFAYRIEIARLHEKNRKEQGSQILTPPPAPSKKELSPEKKAILAKYKAEDIQSLRGVFDAMADEMGFVKADQLESTNFQRQATETLDTFLEKHPEYLPTNDPGGLLWNRFRDEFASYRPATNQRELSRFLEKTHKEVFGIKPTTAIDTKEAARKNIQVASHGGSSRPKPSREGVKRANAPVQGLRTDMLKGFTENELAKITGEE